MNMNLTLVERDSECPMNLRSDSKRVSVEVLKMSSTWLAPNLLTVSVLDSAALGGQTNAI